MSVLSRILKRRDPVLHWLGPDASVAEAIQLMSAKEVGIVPVIDADKLVGVFSERDLLRRVIAAGKSIEATTIGAIMTADPVTASPEETRDSAILKMRERGCRHLPIVEGSQVIDMLSMRDLLHEEIRDREDEIRSLQDYIQNKGGVPGGEPQP